ncbi:hypothetical protein WICPIJ_002283 [Wickerhamomyces pijperi]|uniref:DNA topoisomerase n=1 Tax=Wickerhamomyces pijperi TaxID=599730 RepID=A0A9P8QC19_WICPI|nr:hypothetical protein WICPIJ_002283 [Wickerhamomyces pijperi]
MKILCVAEKNSIGKGVANILGGGRVRTKDSTYKYVKNYEFTFNFPHLGNCDVVMTSVAGHLTGNDFPSNFGWNNVVPGRLFEAPIEEVHSPDQKKVAKNIETLARDADKLMIWTDCDREGEYIGYEILQVARRTNPRLTLENTWRAQFSHLEYSHITHAAKNPIKLDENAVDAVKTRMELDLRTGAAFTRFLCGIFGKYRDKKIISTVSYGSCQFPTLGFVVDRYKRVLNFKPEEFWSIELQVKKDDAPKPVKFTWKRGRLYDRMSAVVIYEYCMRQTTATIRSIESNQTYKYKPLPLTTVQLQKSCSLYFKLSAKQSLEAAEKLYQKGFVSYPRTETDSFPNNLNLTELLSKHKDHRTWGNYVTSLLDENKFSDPRKGKHDDKAHPPIHPVASIELDRLTLNEKKVYEFIVRHFLACCSADACGDSTTVILDWSKEQFTASGLMVRERNYLDIYPYHKWETSQALPRFTRGEVVPLHMAEVKDGKTSPPQYLTETELIALMDANGIGTDATIAEHIEKIIAREYINKDVKRNKTFLVPTLLGISLVEGFESIELQNSLTKPFLRKLLESELDEICQQKKTREQVLHEMVVLYKASFSKVCQFHQVILNTYQSYRRDNGQDVLN